MSTRELKIGIFVMFAFIFTASFFGGWIESGNIVGGIILLLQIVGLLVATIAMIVAFVWIGSKIFKE
jgi:hypothetical protein